MRSLAALLLLASSGVLSVRADALVTTRVLLLASPSVTDPTLLKQRSLLEAESQGLAERQVRVVEWIGGAVRPETAKGLGELQTDRFSAVLFGRDGGEKLRSSTPLTPDRLFATIDAMPMRRQELRSPH